METHCKQASNIQSRIIAELEAAPDSDKRYWTDFEIEMLKKYYGKKDVIAIAKILKRSVTAVSRQASYFGLAFKKRR